MKKITNLRSGKMVSNILMAFAVILTSMLSSVTAFAQTVPEKVDVDINTNGGGSVWYGQPWVWAVGVAIFIVVIVAITRSNSRRV